jgi:hypothetical protein
MSPHCSSELSAVACSSNVQVLDVAELQGVEGGFSPVTGPSERGYPSPDRWSPWPPPW